MTEKGEFIKYKKLRELIETDSASNKINDDFKDQTVLNSHIKVDITACSTLLNVEFEEDDSLRDAILFLGNALVKSEIKFDYCLFSLINFSSLLEAQKTISIKNSTIEKTDRIVDIVFEEGLEFAGTVFKGRLEVVNTNFNGVVNFQHAQFNDHVLFRNCTFSKVPQFKHATFKRLADFGESAFNDEKEGKDGVVYSVNFFGTRFEGPAFFDRVTFEHSPNLYGATFDERLLLRGATFASGLNLEDAVLKNGLDSDGIRGIEGSNTSRRTFRILKSEALEVDNAIEASRYHSLEMGQYLKELWAELIPKKNTEKTSPMRLVIDWLKNLGSLVVFLIHKLTSNFATSWLLPLLWIVVVGAVTYGLVHFVSLGRNDPCSQGVFLSIVEYMILFKRADNIENAAIYAFNKASLGFLYYQFIRAVRHKLR